MPEFFFTDTDDPVDICRDNVFKAVFTKDTPVAKGALSKLVSALIGRDVSIIALCANEPPVDSLQDRQIRFDINCKADNGELVNVEMSLNPAPFEPVRLEFYAAKLFSGQNIKGIAKTYGGLKQTYQIAILAKKQFFPDGEFFHTFEYYDPAHKVSLNGRTQIITLELSKLEKTADKLTEEMSTPERWAFYFEYLTDKSKRSKINEILKKEEGIAMASQVLMTISRDELERFRLMRDEKIELDYQSWYVHAEQEGRAQGMAQGLSQGMAQGIVEGQLRVLELLDQGLSAEEIRQRL